MVRALGTIKAYYDYGMFQAIQVAAIVALRHTEAAVEAQAAIYQHRRDVLVEGLRRIGWDITPPRAGMFVWAKIPDIWRQRMDTLSFAMKLLEEGDVAVSPGSGFGPAGEGYLRMALVENESRLRQAVRQIGRCLGQEAREPKTERAARPVSGSGPIHATQQRYDFNCSLRGHSCAPCGRQIRTRRFRRPLRADAPAAYNRSRRNPERSTG